MSNAVPDNRRLRLVDAHRPVIPSGDYEVSATLHLSGTGAGAKGRHALPDTPIEAAPHPISMLGPRFVLPPGLIHAQYPAPGSISDHKMVVPHISLERSTLPWERSGDNQGNPAIPWLALVMIEKPPGDAATTTTTTLGALKATPPGGFPRFAETAPAPGQPFLRPESGDHDSDTVTLLDLDAATARDVLPDRQALERLTHVRQSLATNGSIADEFAVILCNRTPPAGAHCIMHLVSVEGRYGPDGFLIPRTDTRVLLPSLKSWRFTMAEAPGDFGGLVAGLDLNLLRLPFAHRADAYGFLSSGAVPLTHAGTAETDKRSWYRGPLVPGEILADPPELGAVRTGQDLVHHDMALGMDDVGLAAAWELGRLMTLANGAVTRQLFHWKRTCLQHHCMAEMDHDTGDLPCAMVARSVEFPTSWFDDLAALKGVPFGYLVPDERMLPPESLRFFQLDGAWVRALLAGAFSIGSAPHETCEAFTTRRDAVLARAPKGYSGFVLRSDLAAHWPKMTIWGTRQDGRVTVPLAGQPRRPSPSTMICVFAGDIECVELELPPEVLHFELSPRDPSLGSVIAGKASASALAAHLLTETSRASINVSQKPRGLRQDLPSSDPIITVDRRR